MNMHGPLALVASRRTEKQRTRRLACAAYVAQLRALASKKKQQTFDYYEHRLYLAAIATFVAGRQAVDEAALTRALSESPEAALEVMEATFAATYEAAYDKFKPLNWRVYALAGHATYGSVPATRYVSTRALLRALKKDEKKPLKATPTVRESFTMLDPAAVAWVEQHALELAKDLTATTRKSVKAAIMSAFESGDPIAAQADIYAAIGSAPRAEVIARTEIMTAGNEGRRAGWKQAADDELIPKDSIRVWIASGTACKECWPANGLEATLDGVYPNRSSGPPLHPNCRCTEGLV